MKGQQIDGVLASADALHTQQEGSYQILQEQGTDYLFALKGNQAGVFAKAQAKRFSTERP